MSDPHREFCRRQHRIIGNYLAFEAWRRGLDCIVLVREDLEAFLSLERFKGKRNHWIMEDLKPWFQYQQPYYLTNAGNSIHSLFLSRVPLKQHLPSESMTTDERIHRLGKDAPRTARFTTKNDGKQVPSETKMISKLSILAAGLGEPRQHRGKRKH
ncbi:MAG TPA: hypothetical protein VK210_15430 [Terriglobia bacterium]|nr:hypothetical protein [Terriglobia bacterium]